jgi:hypothetical protein
VLLRCRYAGCSYETAAAAEAGEGSMLVKGVKAVWRQSAPLLQHTLMVRTAAMVLTCSKPAGRVSYMCQIARVRCAAHEVCLCLCGQVRKHCWWIYIHESMQFAASSLAATCPTRCSNCGLITLPVVPQGALEHILMQRDVPGAVMYAEGQIARLLVGLTLCHFV